MWEEIQEKVTSLEQRGGDLGEQSVTLPKGQVRRRLKISLGFSNMEVTSDNSKKSFSVVIGAEATVE